MGGVAPHAGLFGKLEDVLEYGKALRLSYKKKSALFKKQVEGWANGFMTPSGEETTAGKYFSKKSIGHLGFTGTSFWYDPEAELFIVILSNRTYPDRDNAHFNKFRPLIQNIIYEECVL
jgi:CubicO group peptidase (beta-lactamase class C family)